MAKHPSEGTNWQAKRFEANQLFTPSTPINVAELFAGRLSQAYRMVDAIGERGRHVILYGERGVGKTSIAQIVPYLIPTNKERVRYYRVQCFPTDTFDSIGRRILKQIKFEVDNGLYDASQLYPGQLAPDDVIRELEHYNENDIPIIVIDEFNEVTDPTAPILIANLIKAMSDSSVNATVIVVGVADNVAQLISSHESIERCTEQVLMPRMTKDELKEIIEKRLSQLGMTISGDAKWKIINLSKGLPQFIHGLGKQSCFQAIRNHRMSVTEADTDMAIDSLLQSSDQTFKDAYDLAARSNQPGNLFKQVLTACALAKADESGYFTPVSVKEPLSGILGRSVQIATFQNHLKEFVEPRRKCVLQRTGEERAYRFRFRHPAMQPYVIMRGIREGIIDETARQALSCPEAPDLFSSVP